MLVSVVIAAYNAARWLPDTLRSVSDQDLADVEVIVVDDGSTDATPEVVGRFPHVRYLRQANAGQAAARNLGIRHARGRYIALVDADDLWHPSKLRLQVDLLQAGALNWVYCDGDACDATAERLLFRFSAAFRLYDGDVLEPLFLWRFFIPSPTPVVARTVFEHVGYFDESAALRNREDWEMWIRVAAHYPVGVVRRPLVRYRVHDTSSTGREDPHCALRSRLTAIERVVAFAPERLRRLERRAVALQQMAAGQELLARGDLHGGRAVLRTAIRTWPRNLAASASLAASFAGSAGVERLVRLKKWVRRRRSFPDGGPVGGWQI